MYCTYIWPAMTSPFGSMEWTGRLAVLTRWRWFIPKSVSMRPPAWKLPISRTEIGGSAAAQER
jgi:hypothetical protein